MASIRIHGSLGGRPLSTRRAEAESGLRAAAPDDRGSTPVAVNSGSTSLIGVATRRHACAQRRFGSMKKDRGVILRYTEKRCNVFARPFVENAERDDGALNLAELGDARPKPHVLHGAGHELVGKRNVIVR